MDKVDFLNNRLNIYCRNDNESSNDGSNSQGTDDQDNLLSNYILSISVIILKVNTTQVEYSNKMSNGKQTVKSFIDFTL